MKGNRRWLVPWLIVTLVTPLSGCILIGDILDPGFLSALGIDVNAVVPQAGTIIVVFNNQTSFSATFRAVEQADADDPTLGARNFSAEVPATETRNEVLECPVGQIHLGTLDAAFALTTNAVLVANADTGTEIPYTGVSLTSGVEYHCGDLIEVRLMQTGTAGNAGFQIVVEVQRGR